MAVRGVGQIFPEAHERFRAGADRPTGTPAAELVAAYAALMEHPDPAVRRRAAADWCAWEDAVLSLEGMGTPYTDRVDDARLGFVRICSHFFAHGAWLEEGRCSGTPTGSPASPASSSTDAPTSRAPSLPPGSWRGSGPGRSCGWSRAPVTWAARRPGGIC